MQVVMLTSSVSRKGGGLLYAVRRLAEECASAQGTEVSVLGLRDESTDADIASWNVPVRAFTRFSPYGFAPGMSSALGRLSPDVIHLHGLWTYVSLVGRRASRAGRIPYVISPHGMLDPWALQQSRWKKIVAHALVERFNLSAAGCVHALCEAEARSIRAAGVDAPIAVIPNGMDLPDNVPRPPAAWRRELPNDARVLLYLGRVHPKKGLVMLIEAIGSPAVRGQFERGNWHLAVAGWDEKGHVGEIRALAKQLGLEHRIHVIGPQVGDEKAASYRSANAFVLPSLSEGLPLVVLEGWSHALPVLVTHACNLPETTRFRAGVETAPTTRGLQEGLLTLLAQTDSELAAMGRRGLDLVRERFAWAQVRGAMLAVYAWLRGEGDRPASVVDF